LSGGKYLRFNQYQGSQGPGRRAKAPWHVHRSYWFINNLLSIIQQWVITKKITAPAERHFQRVTAISECVLTLGGGELGMMIGGIAVHRGGFTEVEATGGLFRTYTYNAD